MFSISLSNWNRHHALKSPKTCYPSRNSQKDSHRAPPHTCSAPFQAHRGSDELCRWHVSWFCVPCVWGVSGWKRLKVKLMLCLFPNYGMGFKPASVNTKILIYSVIFLKMWSMKSITFVCIAHVILASCLNIWLRIPSWMWSGKKTPQKVSPLV